MAESNNAIYNILKPKFRLEQKGRKQSHDVNQQQEKCGTLAIYIGNIVSADFE